MKRYIVKNNTPIPPPDVDMEVHAGPFDIDELLNKGGEILRREVSNLLMESSRGKLSSASARDIVSYIKLLSEIKESQKGDLENLTDEQLEKLLND
jgi:hypothetical protein